MQQENSLARSKEPDVATLVGQAIVARLCLSAIYNKVSVTLAPHILYTRHGDMFIDAVVVEREGKPPREIKLGTFKLAGLTMTALVDRRFTPHLEFDRASEKYDGSTIWAIGG